jgi:hypothetical protein
MNIGLHSGTPAQLTTADRAIDTLCPALYLGHHQPWFPVLFL